MPFQKGHKYGNRFSMDNQPEKNGHPKGIKNRATISREIFEMVGLLPNDVFEKMQKVYPGIEKSMSVEKIIDIIQASKAIMGSDTQAAKYLKDNVYGSPKQDIDLESRTSITIKIE